MSLHLGFLLFSFIFTAIAAIPFIDLLFKLQLTLPKKHTPVGGGILVITVTTFLFWVLYPLINRFGVYIETSFPIKHELNILFFTFICFGLMGLYSDLTQTFGLKLNARLQNTLLAAFCFLVSFLIYHNLNVSIINMPLFGAVNLNLFYLPIAAGIIYLFIKGFKSSDNLDGFASGNLLITLLAFWFISFSQLDTPMSMFIAIWTGSLIAFLYFNVYPSRIWLGNTGSYSFGATLAVIGLLLGKPFSLMIIGAVFLVTAISALFKFSPLFWLMGRGWPEPKVVQRSWLLVIVCAVIGLWFSQFA